MSWDTNVYYNPESHGLTMFGEAELSLSYEFDMFVVWQDESGQLYFAQDSGCSCPSPFEDYNSVADLSYGTVADVHAALDEWAGSDYRTGYGSTSQAAELHARLAGVK